jgi:heat-inducible transcriptional repressor
LASHDVPIGATQVSLAALNERSREIFRSIVESYLTTGEPVGSRNLSRILPISLSPASVRNVMSDLEQLGLIFAPHTSAGRLPTELGLRFFVDALMQIGDLTDTDRRSIEAQVAGAATNKSVEAVLTEASQMLSGLTRSAGVVLTAKSNARLKHIEFVRLEPERALAVLVAEDGQVENRVLNVPQGLPTSALTEAGNFLNARIRGKTLAELRAEIETAVTQGKAELDQLTQKIISAGLASWSGGDTDERRLIVRGHANLLDDLHALDDLERVRSLFDALETKRGVIGPTRLNYARIIPMVDYTARVVSRLLSG